MKLTLILPALVLFFGYLLLPPVPKVVYTVYEPIPIYYPEFE